MTDRFAQQIMDRLDDIERRLGVMETHILDEGIPSATPHANLDRIGDQCWVLEERKTEGKPGVLRAWSSPSEAPSMAIIELMDGDLIEAHLDYVKFKRPTL